MKRLLIPLFAGLLLSCLHTTVAAQKDRVKEQQEKQEQKEQERAEKQEQKEKEREERNRERKERREQAEKEKYPESVSEHISKQFTVKPNTAKLAVYNLEGSIKVEGYSGDKVLIEIDQTIAAPNKEILEQGKKEIKLGFDQLGDSVVAYMQYPWDTRPHDWHEWNDDRRHIEYRCHLNYTIKVPLNSSIHVSTINDGDISVKDVSGTLVVNNINGAIDIANAKGATQAHTINGNLTVTYKSNPPAASSYYTLNGKLTAVFQPDLSADLQFKSMNGAFYTDFENTSLLAPTVVKNTEKKGDATVYKLNKDTRLRIGAGGKEFKFETLNGNIYIKKQS
jgi:hypothetical protein